jgi:caa(3)-type oxidase subunit IV
MSDHSKDHGHHITPISTLFGTFLALVVLMILTIVSSLVDLTPLWNNVANLGIAFIKATLVVRIFMGLAYSSKLAKLFGMAGFVWLILMGITFGDYTTRSWEPVQGWYGKDKGNTPASSEEMAIDANPEPKPAPKEEERSWF